MKTRATSSPRRRSSLACSASSSSLDESTRRRLLDERLVFVASSSSFSSAWRVGFVAGGRVEGASGRGGGGGFRAKAFRGSGARMSDLVLDFAEKRGGANPERNLVNTHERPLLPSVCQMVVLWKARWLAHCLERLSAPRRALTLQSPILAGEAGAAFCPATNMPRDWARPIPGPYASFSALALGTPSGVVPTGSGTARWQLNCQDPPRSGELRPQQGWE